MAEAAFDPASLHPFPHPEVMRLIRRGAVIPAHPLALTEERRLDETRQRALTRYYIDAGAGGIAVGVHTTQFEIRDPSAGLLRPVLEISSRAADEWLEKSKRPLAKVAGVCGPTPQAVSEAELARDLGYGAALVSLGALRDASDDQLILHLREVARILPLFGFYLQPAVGGRALSYDFWRRFAEIPNAIAIKIAPFNRYQTLDVVRAVAESGRAGEIALYTGNDDSIVFDLLGEYSLGGDLRAKPLRIAGGLLGHWAFDTRSAVALLERIHGVLEKRSEYPADLLRIAPQITDLNGAVFDSRNGFRGCIPGIQEMLRRAGLLRSRACLDPRLDLSPGQLAEIDRASRAYPHLSDGDFVEQNLDRWLR